MDMSKVNGMLHTAEEGGMLLVTLTYREDRDEKKVVEDARKFLTRVDKLRTDKGLSEGASLYAIGKESGTGRTHVRLLMGAGLTRMDLKELWPHGMVGVMPGTAIPAERLLGYIDRTGSGIRTKGMKKA